MEPDGVRDFSTRAANPHRCSGGVLPDAEAVGLGGALVVLVASLRNAPAQRAFRLLLVVTRRDAKDRALWDVVFRCDCKFCLNQIILCCNLRAFM